LAPDPVLGGMKDAMLKLNEKKAAVTADATIEFVTFQVGGEEYGVDIRCIAEVVRPLKITPLPRMPEFIEGVVNLRGVIIPIVDLRKRFAISQIVDNPKKMRILITKGAIPGVSEAAPEALLGLVVDSVQEVLHISGNDIEPAPEAARGQHAGFITSMGKVGDRLIIIINITKILSQQERSALAEAGNAGY
jgi:purine-binding chemotaxis protein CheW